jgi:hypothetical protein
MIDANDDTVEETTECEFCADKDMAILRLNDEVNALQLQYSTVSEMLSSAKRELYDAEMENHLLDKRNKELAAGNPRLKDENGIIPRMPIKDIFEYALEQEIDIHKYLAALRKKKKNYIVIIAVKDTPGLALNRNLERKITALGCKVKLSGNHWHSYIAVLNGGAPVHENISRKEEGLSWAGTVDDLAIEVLSQSYNRGNTASIKVDGIGYAVNGRGLNIVVIQKSSKQVVDSVCFDTHVPEFTCER